MHFWDPNELREILPCVKAEGLGSDFHTSLHLESRQNNERRLQMTGDIVVTMRGIFPFPIMRACLSRKFYSTFDFRQVSVYTASLFETRNYHFLWTQYLKNVLPLRLDCKTKCFASKIRC